MSTESRHVGVPPRPAVPPRPSAAPGPAPTAPRPLVPPARGDRVPPEEITVRLRPLPGTPPPGRFPPEPAGPTVPNGPAAPAGPFAPVPAHRLRPVGAHPRALAAATCAILGIGLIVGALTGSWLSADGAEAKDDTSSLAASADLWHSVPVDTLFPPAVQGEGAGPGGADRRWDRVAVAPDSGCADAFDPLLAEVLAPAGCARLLRATYADATSSHVITVGLLFTTADETATAALRTRFERDGLDRRADLIPRPYGVVGTPAAGFGVAQRASWSIRVLTDVPAVVYAVSGFADGRVVGAPQPAALAMDEDATTAPAQSGLGHDAQGLADRIEGGLRKAAARDLEPRR